MAVSSVIYAAILVLAAPSVASGEGAIVQPRKSSLRSSGGAKAFQATIRNAMGEAMGCGGHISEKELAAIEKSLSQMWKALPKNAWGRVERRSLRYLAHRYFNKKSALMVRGYEPSRATNASRWADSDILSQRVPAYVESVLESKHAEEHGFDLQDAVYMVATVEELIFDSEGTLLEKVYGILERDPGQMLTSLGMDLVLEDYMVHWMLGEDEESIKFAMANKYVLAESIPHWNKVTAFAHGQVQAVKFRRQRTPAAESRPGRHALSEQYSFEDAHEIVGGITKSFAHFWDSECTSMKAALVQMDTHHTGRVPLSKFYSSALNTEWRFGESESYLRELGALDETSSWLGKQVIIPNYLQAASNCIVSTPHYMVCCVNECESLLGEIESAVGAEVASPEELLGLVANMTSQATIDEDEPPHLSPSLRSQLAQIAESNNGKVPLHGRLFAQWLHYVFPRECPFPHKQGSTVAATPTGFGDGSIATKDEMSKHASDEANVSDALATMGKEELQWMSQWSHEEELIADYGSSLRTSSGSWYLAMAGFLLLLVCGVVGTVGLNRRKMMGSEAGLLPTHSKSHFI